MIHSIVTFCLFANSIIVKNMISMAYQIHGILYKNSIFSYLRTTSSPEYITKLLSIFCLPASPD